ncbi:helix-turn-helix domain-containing protein [Sphingosinicella soli]|uniref:AraC family transcriptional regulator n=1 Tax=Sphingosinicella soli TaxID=333708 RepID=A0A7W7F8I1_9SPHN|nr:helix-turn-helix transcriptional regulator [Sphingosinicella soli]MBB4631673.1 AraC family transcriptional regulator [Sphingosinicella soli]
MPADSVVENEIAADGVSVQLISHDWSSPVECEFAEASTDHVIALQCQPPQAVSMGRYMESGDREFSRIGRVLVIPAGQALHVRATGGPVQAVRCAVSEQAVNRIAGFDAIFRRRTMREALDIRDRRIADTLKRMGEEVRHPGFASTMLIDSLSTSLIIDMTRHLEMTCGSSENRHKGGLTVRQLKLLSDYIDSAPPGMTLVSLARLVGLSRRHLSRAFRQSTGQTVHEYVELTRFRRACELLSTTDLHLKEIAWRTGFGNPCSFSTAFRKVGGEAPSAFRRRMQLK